MKEWATLIGVQTELKLAIQKKASGTVRCKRYIKWLWFGQRGGQRGKSRRIRKKE
jgi:hypothetical protein